MPAARLSDQLAQRIAALIDGGEFSEGGRLPAEGDLADRFGVSRPVIREALSRLRVKGVIVSRKGSGSFVQKRSDPSAAAPLDGRFGPVRSLAEVKHCFEFRAALESEAAVFAARNRTPDALAAMRDALRGIESAIASGLIGMSPDFEFHVAIARASGNGFFETVMRQMRTPIAFAIDLARSLSLTRPLEHVMTIQAEHVAIYEAIEAQDGETARTAMRSHLENACARIFDGPDSVGGALRNAPGPQDADAS